MIDYSYNTSIKSVKNFEKWWRIQSNNLLGIRSLGWFEKSSNYTVANLINDISVLFVSGWFIKWLFIFNNQTIY